MLRDLFSQVENGRFGRAVAGLMSGWRVEVVYRRSDDVRGFIRYDGKVFAVSICEIAGVLVASCSCHDHMRRGSLCKHVAALAMHELGAAAQARSEHRELEELG